MQLCNVAIISHSPHLCGAEKMLLNLAKTLQQSNTLKPTVIIPMASSGPLSEALGADGVNWLDAPRQEWFISQRRGNFQSFAETTFSTALTYAGILKAARAEVVIINTLTNLEGVLAAILLDLPYVVWVHGILDAKMLGYSNRFARICENFILENANKVICCSDWTRDHFITRIDPGKVVTISNWTDVPLNLTKNLRCGSVAMLSTLEKNKGILTAIDALEILADEQICLDIYGDGHDKELFIGIVEKRGLQKAIRFHDRVVDVNAIYDSARVIIFPSLMESFGMVAIESMSRGTPVVASSVGGLKEIIKDRQTGMLCEAGEADAFAAAIRELITNQNLWNKISVKAHKSVLDQYNGEKSSAKFTKIIHQVSKKFTGHSHATATLLNFFGLIGIGEVMPSSKVLTQPVTSALTSLSLEANTSESRSNTEFASFSSNFEGLKDGWLLSGWAVSRNNGDRCFLDLYVDDKFHGHFYPNLYRGDLQSAGFIEPNCAFLCPIPPEYCDGMYHNFSLRFHETDLELSGSPKIELTSRYNSYVEGVTSGQYLTGWIQALDGQDNQAIECRVDGKYFSKTLPTDPRQDVVAAGFLGGLGFSFKLPVTVFDGKPHLIEVTRAIDGDNLKNSPIEIVLTDATKCSMKELYAQGDFSAEDLMEFADWLIALQPTAHTA